MRTWIKQDPKKKNWGVIAVAVVAGVTVEAAAKAIGKNGTTTTKQLTKGLQALGYDCPNRCKPIHKLWGFPSTDLGIAQMHNPARKSGWHWVVIDGLKIYDGIFGDEDGHVKWPDGCKMTSFIPITKKI